MMHLEHNRYKCCEIYYRAVNIVVRTGDHSETHADTVRPTAHNYLLMMYTGAQSSLQCNKCGKAVVCPSADVDYVEKPAGKSCCLIM